MTLFIDRNTGKKLGRALRAVGISVVLHTERYAGVDEDKTSDRVWIKTAADNDEVILSRDGKIARIDAELAAIVDNGARCVILEVGNASPLDFLIALMGAWRKLLVIIATEPAPWVYGVNRAGRLRRIYPRP